MYVEGTSTSTRCAEHASALKFGSKGARRRISTTPPARAFAASTHLSASSQGGRQHAHTSPHAAAPGAKARCARVVDEAPVRPLTAPAAPTGKVSAKDTQVGLSSGLVNTAAGATSGDDVAGALRAARRSK